MDPKLFDKLQRERYFVEIGYFDLFQPPEEWLGESEAPSWDPESAQLPLLPSDAKSIATHRLRDHLRNLHQDEIKIYSSEARICESERHDWYYSVVIRYWWKGANLLGQPASACVLVRMDRVPLIAPTRWTELKPDGLLEAKHNWASGLTPQPKETDL